MDAYLFACDTCGKVGHIIESRYKNGRYFCDDECIRLYNPLCLAFSRFATLDYSELEVMLLEQEIDGQLDELTPQSPRLKEMDLSVADLAL